MCGEKAASEPKEILCCLCFRIKRKFIGLAAISCTDDLLYFYICAACLEAGRIKQKRLKLYGARRQALRKDEPHRHLKAPARRAYSTECCTQNQN